MRLIMVVQLLMTFQMLMATLDIFHKYLTYMAGRICHVGGAQVKLKELFKINVQPITALNVNVRQPKNFI